VSTGFGLMIESLVAVLLLVTIGYCVVLNGRLKRLKADEQALKATISELITATEIAGRAVAGLKATAQEADRTLGERLRAAERLSADLDRQLRGGEAMLGLFPRDPNAPASVPTPAAVVPDWPDPKAVVAAAQAFADRARERARETRGRSGCMIRLLRDFRLVPIVLFATITLFVLKTVGLLVDGRYALGEGDSADITGTPAAKAPPLNAARPDNSKQSWAQQVFNYPDVTGAAGESKAVEAKEAPKPARPAAKPEEPKTNTGWIPVPVDSARPRSPAEQAILERLQERRNELDARARELEMRESLIKAAEKRLEGRVAELKELEARINNAVQTKEEGEAARFKNLVTMYENMKAKEAAKIFDRLDTRVLFEVATQITPRRMSDILAQMSPEAAERLTLALAARPDKDKPAELPKIEGKPSN
jgi:flagellar motility protein MotE (MotC chaperone)